MTLSLDDRFRGRGTRFRLFAQSPVLPGFETPETVWVSPPPHRIGPGPSDERMFAIRPLDKEPYDDDGLPPWRGRIARPLPPGPDGHFDHLDPESEDFATAHMFGSVRRVLDIWEHYLGGPIPWHFGFSHRRLELVTRVPWDNAHFGWGFMECGEGKDDQGALRPYALNFDILAHETGHGLIFAISGLPTPETISAAYRGFHESASDCVAMLSALHFVSVMRHVLDATHGELYRENEMNRIGELSRTRQIRVAANALTLDDVVSFDTPPQKLTGKQVHALGQPLTGAVFDILLEFYLQRLVELGVVCDEEAARQRKAAMESKTGTLSDHTLADEYERAPEMFLVALRDARDAVGRRLAETWRRLSPAGLSYSGIRRTFLDVDAGLSGARYRPAIESSFDWRGITA